MEEVPKKIRNTRNGTEKVSMSFFEQYRKLIVVNAVFLILVGLVVWRISANDQALVQGDMPIPPNVVVLTSSSSPVRLQIPSIGLDAHVQLVGKARSGNMAVPNNFTDVGWYRLGFYPGTAGNAVMAGHLDHGGGNHPAVFADLDKLSIGDLVYVLNEKGDKLQFKVIGTSLYDYNNAPLEQIFGSSTMSHLNLITCDGIWDSAKKIYNKRLVVFTELAGVVKPASAKVATTTLKTKTN